MAVLHTHSRRLDYHPHVHVLMPAAALDARHRLWRTKTSKNNADYLFNHKALAKMFRAKMLHCLSQAGLALPARHPARWVVHCKCVGSGAKTLVYLGRYLYRGVIREKDILACKDGQVTFRYQDGKSQRWQTRTVPGATFLWMLLQHVLPKGLRRARNFGFLHPNSKRLIQLLQYLLQIDLSRALAHLRPRPCFSCSCGAQMHVVRTRIQPIDARAAAADGAAAGAAM